MGENDDLQGFFDSMLAPDASAASDATNAPSAPDAPDAANASDAIQAAEAMDVPEASAALQHPDAPEAAPADEQSILVDAVEADATPEVAEPTVALASGPVPETAEEDGGAAAVESMPEEPLAEEWPPDDATDAGSQASIAASSDIPVEAAAVASVSTAATTAAPAVAGREVAHAEAPPTPSPGHRPSLQVPIPNQHGLEPPGGIPVQVPAPVPEEPDPHAEPPREWVVFFLGDQTYALDVHLVREIVRPPQLEPMPHAPDTLIGMANLRGIVVPVFDIAKLLGWTPAERNGLARVIVIEHDDDMVGLLVDAVEEILRFDGAKVEPPPSVGALTQHVVALLRQPERLVQLLDPETLFGAI